MSERTTGGQQRNPTHPDEAASRENHDEQGVGRGPYAPPGRDASGNPQPSVPHEGLLGRIAVALVAGLSVVLLAVGVAGLVVSADADFFGQPDTTVLALRLNSAHSVLLLITAIAGLASLVRRSSLRMFAGALAGVYLLVFVFGAAYSLNTGTATFLDLNTPDHVLHGVMAALGFVTLMIASARIVEPPPGPPPYPEALPDRDDD
jgi:hypothetical protein